MSLNSVLYVSPFHSFSSKIREEDYRQIQTNVPFLAPEILAVFANSQIFHDSQPNKSLAIVHKSPAASAAIIDEKKCIRDADVEKKLLKRLEGNNFLSKVFVERKHEINLKK